MNLFSKYGIYIFLSVLSPLINAQELSDQFNIDASSKYIERAKNFNPSANMPFGTPCDTTGTLKDDYEQMNRLLSSGEGAEAEAQGNLLATKSASCALVHRGKQNAPVAKWAFLTGAGLMAGLMNNPPQRDNNLTTRVRTYLSFAQSYGMHSADNALTVLGKLTKSVATSSSAPRAISSTTMVAEFSENALSFWKKK